MAYTIKKLDRPAAGAGAPAVGSRFAYLVPLRHTKSFPDPDENGVLLSTLPTFEQGYGFVPVYITSSTRELNMETQGDQDARGFKLSFKGSHPGTEQEALEFVANNLDEDFSVWIPGCTAAEPVKVLGRPCAPLVFKASHKAGKDGSKFEFTFEQEIPGKSTYQLFNGSLEAALMPDASVAGVMTTASTTSRTSSKTTTAEA